MSFILNRLNEVSTKYNIQNVHRYPMHWVLVKYDPFSLVVALFNDSIINNDKHCVVTGDPYLIMTSTV